MESIRPGWPAAPGPARFCLRQQIGPALSAFRVSLAGRRARLSEDEWFVVNIVLWLFGPRHRAVLVFALAHYGVCTRVDVR